MGFFSYDSAAFQHRRYHVTALVQQNPHRHNLTLLRFVCDLPSSSVFRLTDFQKFPYFMYTTCFYIRDSCETHINFISVPQHYQVSINYEV
jgi:hypothetical protein